MRPSDAYVGLDVQAIALRVRAVVQAAAGAPCDVRIGEEHVGFRNVGIDLPRARRTASATRVLRARVREALERAGVVMAEHALAPKVEGDIRGQIRVREAEASSFGAVSCPLPKREDE